MKHILLPVFLLSSLFVFSQEKEADVKQLIFKKDSLFWVAYNHCNTEAMDSSFTDDVEFYHDKGGLILGAKNLIGDLRKNLCSNGDFKLVRKGTSYEQLFIEEGGDIA